MAIPNRPVVDTEKSEQNILNNSYDKDFDVLVVEVLGYNTDNNDLRRVATTSTGLLKVVIA